MKLEYYPSQEFKNKAAEITAKYLNPQKYKVFIFGSRVKGDNSLRSDIDVGILGDNAVPLVKMFKIREEFDNLPVLYKIDLVDFKVASEKFRKEALKNIEYV